jgi:1-acyl-sn-glycerol-3-phosphate acyltransferase
MRNRAIAPMVAWPAVQAVTPPYEVLYDAVGLGMATYTRSAFDVRVLGGHGERFVPGLMLVSAHRAETDVPLLCGAVYFRYAVWRNRATRLHFAARDDLFEQGFFAGFPPSLPLWLRRALYPLNAGSGLSRVRVHPIRGLGTMTLGQALGTLQPDVRLADVLPAGIEARLRARARSARLPDPERVGDVLHGSYADLLWTSCTPETLPAPAFAEAWRRRAAAATNDLRTLVGLVRDRHALLVFPEGRPSPDGEIGPIRRGVTALIRRGGPEIIQPVGLAYDPLVAGRTRAYVALPPRCDPPVGDVEAWALALIRRAAPLTVGQVVADRLVAAAEEGRDRMRPAELDESLADAVSAAGGQGRLHDAELGTLRGRRESLDEALAACIARGLVLRRGAAELGLAASAIAGDGAVQRLALEYRSARAPVASAPAP